MRKIERELRREFPDAEIETSGGNHLRLKIQGKTVLVSNSPSCRFFLRHVRADVKKRMMEEPSESKAAG